MALREEKPMGEDKSWQAHAGFGGGGKWIIGLVLVLVLGGALVGVLFASGVIDTDGGGLQRVLPFVIGPVVLLAIIVPLLLTRRGGGRIALEGDRLSISDKRGRRELPLADLQLSLGKLFTGGQYMGSLCRLRSSRDEQAVTLLGSGVELAAERYDAADSSRYRFDYALAGDAFRELIEALQTRGLQPERRAPAAAAPARPAAAGEQVFDAVADPSRNVFKIVALSFGAVMFVGILGAVAQSLLRDAGGADATTIGAVMSVLGIGLPAAVIFFMFRRGRGKSRLRLSDQAVALERGGVERFRVELPAAEATPLLWRTSSRYGSHNQGPAVRLHDRAGKKLTLGVRDPSQAPADAAKKVGTVDYVLSADAGRALLALLDRRGGRA
jgi:hypothetical protein